MNSIKIPIKSSIKQLKELRFIFCPLSSNSIGTRKWIDSSIISEIKQNPEVQFLIRESEGTDPVVLARFSKKSYTLICYLILII